MSRLTPSTDGSAADDAALDDLVRMTPCPMAPCYRGVWRCGEDAERCRDDGQGACERGIKERLQKVKGVGESRSCFETSETPV